MAYEFIVFEKQDRIARLTLNRPEKLNALSPALLKEFDQPIAGVDDDNELHVLIIKGAGRAFSAGYDIVQSGSASASTGVMTIRQAERKNIDRWLKLWGLSKVVIAQVHGYCLAGASEMAAFCDLVIAADDAKFGYPIVRGQGTPPALMWPWLIGARKTKELLYTGDSVTGVEAAQIGLANRAVPAEKLEEEVERLAARIAMAPLDLLLLNKASVNAASEAMGIRSAIQYGFANHIIGHATTSALDFGRTRAAKGLHTALQERDSPFEK